ncbi:MAG TPA: glutathionylspermidine synthase family protein [Pseudonocardia sp.]
MRRERSTPRKNWEQIVSEQGLCYGSPGRGIGGVSRPYWDESVHYVFEMDEILALEADVELLHSMCLSAVDHVVTTERYKDFALPEWCWEAVGASWRRSDPHLYGRFDLRYDGTGPAHLLEYNADTPTTLLEAAILQWHWLKDTHPDDDQWNSLHEQLVARWAEIAATLPGSEVHFSWSGADASGEDHVTTAYLQETAAEAGIDTVGLAIEDIGWEPAMDRFVDLAESQIAALVKLYPWEWILTDDFGKHAVRSLPETLWIEPLWKTLLSNKALLAVLWELYPGHPNLLPAYLDEPGMLTEYVRKPRLGREGANISIVAPGYEVETAGVYGEGGLGGGWVYQLFDPLPVFDGFRPALGAWVVGDTSAGLGIRETAGLVTDDGAAFVPHRIPGS